MLCNSTHNSLQAHGITTSAAHIIVEQRLKSAVVARDKVDNVSWWHQDTYIKRIYKAPIKATVSQHRRPC